MQNLFNEDINSRPQRLCKKCGKCCRIYNCNHLGEDNLCLVYEDRPENCHNFPCSPWEEIPEGCGFEGWLFQKREEIKQQVRKHKETLLLFEVMLKTANPEQVEKLTEDIEKIGQIIEIYAKYGSKDW